MRHAIRKALSWFLFLTGLSTLAFFAGVSVYKGLPSQENAAWYFWPLCSFLLAAFPALYLRRLYRQQPGRPRGRWQILLSDLVLVSLLAGLFFAVWSACAPQTFAFKGMGLGLVASFALLAGVLAASRAGFQAFPWKHVYAIGIVLRSLGYVGLTLSLGLLVICTIAGQTNRLLFHAFPPDWHKDDFPFLFVPVRWGLPALLPGLFLCWLARRRLPPAGGAASSPQQPVHDATGPIPSTQNAPVFQFSLKSLLLVVLTIAAWMYLIFTWYGVGFCVGLLTLSVILLTVTFYRKPRYIGGLALTGILWSLLAPLIVAYIDAILGRRFGLCPKMVAILTGYVGTEVFLFAWVNPYRAPFKHDRASVLLAVQYPVVFFLYMFAAGTALSGLRRLFH